MSALTTYLILPKRNEAAMIQATDTTPTHSIWCIRTDQRVSCGVKIGVVTGLHFLWSTD